MTLIFAFILSINPLFAFGTQPLCHDVASTHFVEQEDPEAEWRNQFNLLFRELMLGDAQKGESELLFYWHMSYPFLLVPVDASTKAMAHSTKRLRVYKNTDNLELPSPLNYVNKFLGIRPTSNKEILDAFLSNFRGTVSEDIVEAVKNIETVINHLADIRQSFGYVATGQPNFGGTIIGTFRIFNGVPSHSNTPPFLPMEYSFEKDGVKTQTAERLNRMRAENPHALIFEFGSSSNGASSHLIDRVRGMLDLFYLRYYIDSLPDHALFLAHTTQEDSTKRSARLRRFQSRYGFRHVETIHVPGQKEEEYVLEATAGELKASYRKLYPLPPRRIRILPP